MPDSFVPDERDLRFTSTGSNFIPRNIKYIPACPVGLADRTGVVDPHQADGLLPLRVRDLRLELEPRLNIKKDLTGQAKFTIFQRSKNIIKLPDWIIKKAQILFRRSTIRFLFRAFLLSGFRDCF
jgi:hypothetical protein